MTAGTWNPTIEQGADWTVELTWADDGTPIDLTGYTPGITRFQRRCHLTIRA